MYFWRIKKLKKSLIEKPLSDREALPYLVVANGLSAALAFFSILLISDIEIGSEFTTWHDVLLIGVLEVTLYWRTGVHIRDVAMRAKNVLI
jgi:hypothetical protein